VSSRRAEVGVIQLDSIVTATHQKENETKKKTLKFMEENLGKVQKIVKMNFPDKIENLYSKLIKNTIINHFQPN